MTGVEASQYKMSIKVREFVLANPDLFPTQTMSGEAAAALVAATDAMTNSEAAIRVGRGSERSTVTSKAVAYEALREDLVRIMRTADGIDDYSPGFADKFKPLTSKSVHELLHTAREYLQNAKPVAARFIAHDMPEDFLEDLEQDIAQLTAAVNEQESGRRARVSADVDFDRAMAEAMKAIRLLDSCVPNKLQNNASLLAVWETARRIEYPPRRRRNATDANAATPEAAASSDAAAAGV